MSDLQRDTRELVQRLQDAPPAELTLWIGSRDLKRIQRRARKKNPARGGVL